MNTNTDDVDEAKLKLKELFNQSVNEMEKLFNDYEYILSHQENHLDDYILDIKNKIDIQREEVIQEICRASNQMMQTLDEYYKKCIDNLPNLKGTAQKVKEALNKSKVKLYEKKMMVELNDIEEDNLKIAIKEIRKNTLKYKKIKENYENQLRMKQHYEFNRVKYESSNEIFGELEVEIKNSKFANFQYHLVRSFGEPSNDNFTSTFDIFDDYKIAILNDQNEILIFNLQTTKFIKSIKNRSCEITTLKWINKSTLACGFENNHIKILNLDIDGECIKQLEGHMQSINYLCLNKEKNQLISCSTDDNIKIWNLDNYECIKNIAFEKIEIDYLSLNSKGHLITSSMKDKSIRLFDSNNDYNCELKFKYSQFLLDVQLTPEGNIACIHEDGNIEIFDYRTGHRLSFNKIFEKNEDNIWLRLVKFISHTVILLISFDHRIDDLLIQLFDLNKNKFIVDYEKNGIFSSERPHYIFNNGDILCLDPWVENPGYFDFFSQVKILRLN